MAPANYLLHLVHPHKDFIKTCTLIISIHIQLTIKNMGIDIPETSLFWYNCWSISLNLYVGVPMLSGAIIYVLMALYYKITRVVLFAIGDRYFFTFNHLLDAV